MASRVHCYVIDRPGGVEAPHPEAQRLRCVSKDEAGSVALWFETRLRRSSP